VSHAFPLLSAPSPALRIVRLDVRLRSDVYRYEPPRPCPPDPSSCWGTAIASVRIPSVIPGRTRGCLILGSPGDFGFRGDQALFTVVMEAYLQGVRLEDRRFRCGADGEAADEGGLEPARVSASRSERQHRCSRVVGHTSLSAPRTRARRPRRPVSERPCRVGAVTQQIRPRFDRFPVADGRATSSSRSSTAGERLRPRSHGPVARESPVDRGSVVAAGALVANGVPDALGEPPKADTVHRPATGRAAHGRLLSGPGCMQ
jgi:hypothetical protein